MAARSTPGHLAGPPGPLHPGRKVPLRALPTRPLPPEWIMKNPPSSAKISRNSSGQKSNADAPTPFDADPTGPAAPAFPRNRVPGGAHRPNTRARNSSKGSNLPNTYFWVTNRYPTVAEMISGDPDGSRRVGDLRPWFRGSAEPATHGGQQRGSRHRGLGSASRSTAGAKANVADGDDARQDVDRAESRPVVHAAPMWVR